MPVASSVGYIIWGSVSLSVSVKWKTFALVELKVSAQYLVDISGKWWGAADAIVMYLIVCLSLTMLFNSVNLCISFHICKNRGKKIIS